MKNYANQGQSVRASSFGLIFNHLPSRQPEPGRAIRLSHVNNIPKRFLGSNQLQLVQHWRVEKYMKKTKDNDFKLEHWANEQQLERLADMYQRQGNYEAAIATLNLLLKLKNKTPVIKRTA